MSHPALQGINAKLDGAQDRLKVLKGRLDQGAVTDLLTVRTDRDRKGWVRVRVQELAEIPQEWHVWIGECVHDMRSALDHLAYTLNVIGFRSDPPLNWEVSQFPIYPHRKRFRAMARTRPDKCMIGFFPRGTRTRVEALQPYHRRKDLDIRWLAVLHELSKVDKHRGFPITAVTPNLVTLPSTVEGHPVADDWAESFMRLKPNATFMRLKVPTLPLSAEHPQVDFGYACDLQFDRKAAHAPIPLLLPYESVDFVLGQILVHIREAVVPAFEPFLG